MYNTEQCSLYLLCYTLYPGTYFYLVTGNLCLFTVFIQFPSPHSLSLIITASVISFSMSLVYLFVFEVQLTHNTMLVPSARCSSDLIFLYVSKWAPWDKSSYHLSPYKYITLLLIIFPTLCISYFWFFHVVMESLYLSITSLSSTHPTPPSIPSPLWQQTWLDRGSL